MWKNVFRAPGVLGETQAARNRYQFSAAAPTGKQTSRNNETRRQFPQQKPINLSLLTRRGKIVHFSQTGRGACMQAAYFKLTAVCFSPRNEAPPLAALAPQQIWLYPLGLGPKGKTYYKKE